MVKMKKNQLSGLCLLLSPIETEFKEDILLMCIEQVSWQSVETYQGITFLKNYSADTK